MGFTVPNVVELATLNERLTLPWTLRLYSTDITINGATTAAAFAGQEVTGGGYAAKAIALTDWTITPAAAAGDAPIAVTATQLWTFTGATGGSTQIWGYYATRNSDGTLMLAERFSSALVPFIPEAGSQVRVLLRYSVTSQF